MSTLPNGITGFDPMPYDYKRWNGAVWADVQTDSYNRTLAKIERHHGAGMNVEQLVNGLYNLAHGFELDGI